MENNNTEPFEELLIPRGELRNISSTSYRVYTDRKNYKLVEAACALEALTTSGVGAAYKIERYDPLSENIIHINYAMSGARNGAMPDEPAQVLPIEVQPPVADPASPLSTADVKKLLDGEQ